ncbi:hypothetical protein ORI20_31645 [Mycobacterium sp. CVI_P3]|uniref:Uncharacterized protein n=1 Tax=Mycobacterium pinniadriaticum TaxID=2994102 RepID=A0ABT3SP13_9MYCO|nr:hypothetical protein [Mycobacterium pinniadriaticum]MCX2934822.1 hypothetical protein [Mycobacterium pinniadriaticum]MCX2941261.1 hypothetical protein [Mycobacterium pinniadriaticum]
MTSPSSANKGDQTLESANRLQAEHLRSMLLAQCEQLDADLATYGCALERYQRRGEQTQTRRIRSMIRAAERERRTVQDLIAGLERRYLAAEKARSEQGRHPLAGMAPARPGTPRVHPYPSPNRIIRT